ncbi:hypothetical protein BDV40DRAFT_263125 [Aspergillus tamarii]|uniref:Uncharacterized protein n=1 Tax=Aspergillus tamarii TaxID=41984 RepID=A0A5N6UXL4_ASPTM|nr:hypothetical protein BDV40DRAFT_263125 [Aspergillus tamarii]
MSFVQVTQTSSVHFLVLYISISLLQLSFHSANYVGLFHPRSVSHCNRPFLYSSSSQH